MAAQDLIPLFDLDYGTAEEEGVLGVLRRRWLTMGEETRAFEQEFAAYIGAEHAVAVANCTAGLHLANVAVGVGPDTEVICPSLTFVATANSVLYAGATPVFADIASLDDWTLSPADVEAKITDRTRAIMVMHYAGFACDMDAILGVARRHGLAVIEDAAHAPGSELHGRKLGTFGDVSCFSFFSNKNLATGEGGMVCTNNAETAAKLRLLRSHGMTTLTLERHKGHSFSYDVVAHGYNYRIDEIHSALGRVQLGKLDQGNRLRRQAADCYRRLLDGVEGVRVPFEHHRGEPNYHIYPVLLPGDVGRHGLMQELRTWGIQTSIHYRPVHTFTHYRERLGAIALPVTEEIGRRELTLPMFPGLSEAQVSRVVGELRRGTETA